MDLIQCWKDRPVRRCRLNEEDNIRRYWKRYLNTAHIMAPGAGNSIGNAAHAIYSKYQDFYLNPGKNFDYFNAYS
jgi:hypothetical protein